MERVELVGLGGRAPSAIRASSHDH
jgi:hypothetical protein